MRVARTRFRVVAIITGSYRGQDMVNRSWQITRRQEKELLELLDRPPDVEGIVPGLAAEAMLGVGQEHGVTVLELEEDPEEAKIDEAINMPVRTLINWTTEEGNVGIGIIYGLRPEPKPGEDGVEVPLVRDGSVIIKADEFDQWLTDMRKWWDSVRG